MKKKSFKKLLKSIDQAREMTPKRKSKVCRVDSGTKIRKCKCGYLIKTYHIPTPRKRRER